MKVMIKFELQAQNEKQKEIISFFQRILKDTKTYKGCIRVKLSHLQRTENEFVLIEYWESTQLFHNYLDWRKEIGDFDTLRNLLSKNSNITIFDVITSA